MSLYNHDSRIPNKSIDTIAREVITGKYGNGQTRKDALEKMGYDYNDIQAKVNDLLGLNKYLTTLQKGDVVKLITTATYIDGQAIPQWVKDSSLYIRDINDERVTISTLKTGQITGVVNKKYMTKI